MAVVRTDALTKRYPGVTALDRLSLEIGHGVTGLVGANGAGKSTLIKILLGLLGEPRGEAACSASTSEPTASAFANGSDTCQRTTAFPATCRPPNSLRAVRRALFAHSLRGVYGIGWGKSKILPIALFVISCLPALVLAVVTVIGAGQGASASRCSPTPGTPW